MRATTIALLLLGASPIALAAPVTMAPASLQRVAKIDERYQSYNVEMAEVIGGNFWKPYEKGARPPAPTPSDAGIGEFVIGGSNPNLFQALPPVDLARSRLRKLAAKLGPAYVRVSGTWANSVYFNDSDAAPPTQPPAGFNGILTRPEWKGVVEFARAVNARIVTSFAISAGVRDAQGAWTPEQARKLVAYTRSVGGEIAAAELFNEPTMPSAGGAPSGYDAAAFARDSTLFRRFALQDAPSMLVLGPGSVGEGGALVVPESVPTISSEAMLAAEPRPVFDAFSFHYYGAVSQRCAAMGKDMLTTPEAALSEEWLGRSDKIFDFYERLRDRFQPGKPMWITETGDAACGGNPWAPTFLDTFRYLDQLGRLARRGLAVHMHNTLASSEYGLLDARTLLPRPNYWAALLWRRLMGEIVLDAGPSRDGLHLYAHCLRGRSGGVAFLAINNSRTRAESVSIPFAATRYTLAAKTLQDASVQLNGRDLKLGVNDEMPELRGSSIQAGTITLAPATITFVAVRDAGNGSCK
jgi:heparanase 1